MMVIKKGKDEKQSVTHGSATTKVTGVHFNRPMDVLSTNESQKNLLKNDDGLISERSSNFS